MLAFGQLGYESTDGIGAQPGQMPPPDVDVGGTVVQLVAGGYHTCALLDTGAVRCWGIGSSLGYENTETIGDQAGEMPPSDVDVGGTTVQIAAGEFHTCALLDDGTVRCWGHNEAGQLGYGHSDTIGDEQGEMPPPEVDVGGTVIGITAGVGHTCALLIGGVVRGWGWGSVGQLGSGDTAHIGDAPMEMPPPDVDIGGVATSIDTYGWHTCAVLVTGSVRCWGRNFNGQLGYGHTDDLGDQPSEMPPPDVDVGSTVTQVVTGYSRTCARLTGGAVRCWGRNHVGQLGYEHTDDIGDDINEMPPADVSLGGPASALAAGASQTCAIVDSGVRCWGAGDAGELGNGSTEHIGDDPGEMPPPYVKVD